MKTSDLTFCALMSAFSLLALFAAGILSVFDLSLLTLSGIGPAMACVRTGFKGGFVTYAATGILSFLLLGNQPFALAFVLFFGVYPVVKSLIEKIRNIVGEWVCKLVLFFMSLTILFLLADSFFDGFLPEYWPSWPSWPLWPMGGVLFVFYDIALGRVIWFLTVRLGFDKASK